ncbi:Nitrogen assimilation transcription factor nit-4 [Colletotrichum orbiculare MAFF 240422]|uniref:Nitrogen assimilation transcription factor nit-4 n=1 Tax=Colletotrichum orbiculare (strain 104-T / ATCC 96160 / CBS 514.97 / LARS 414 / MAFF 240422) TaxID=1213857 RepID=N4VLY5_COLOR|nr:Nitrogen assimilation transcription factor nit-4 [Colletotrichum orbiculare MAFF 240422]
MDEQDSLMFSATSASSLTNPPTSSSTAAPPTKKKSRRGGDSASQKRRCVSTACIACRRRKSKCDGAVPSCAACASVYGTECVYDPNSDHRRKGVYREKIDSMKARNSTLQILIEAILNASEDEVPDIVKKIRTCDSLDTVAEQILKQETLLQEAEDNDQGDDEYTTDMSVEGERELARKMGELRLENGSVRFIGGTSHLIYLGDPSEGNSNEPDSDTNSTNEDPTTSWTRVTQDKDLIIHLMNMYFSWHYTYFTTLSKTLFNRDFIKGRHGVHHRGTIYCSPLLVNAMLALGCHFTSVPGAYGTPGDSRTKGDHFFAEAKRLIVENDEYERPRLVTVQALALMSVREAGCGREAKGWVYSGMAFRMAQDIGLNFDDGGMSADKQNLGEHAVDARRMTFWGCFLFDKAWSNYLGRLPQIPKNSYNVPKYDVFPSEDAEMWAPYTDTGFDQTCQQPSRTRAIGLQLSLLCEISSDLLLFFYHPNHIGRSSGKAVELKKLSELHRRLEDWRKELPQELEPKEGQLPNVILVHMFFHLQYIHLFRPFLKYTPSASPLPSHVSPRRICTANAGAISKLMRLYKKTWNLRQICNIAVYMIHSACTIHLLNLPEKTAKRDVIHGVKHLEEIAEDWICARRTLSIISVLARKWNVELPEEASAVLQRTDEKYGHFNTSDVPSPLSHTTASPSPPQNPLSPTTSKAEQYSPLNQYAQAQMSQHEVSPSTADLIMASASLAQISGARPPSRQPNARGNPTMNLGPDAMGGWSGAGVSRSTPSYPQQGFHTMGGSHGNSNNNNNLNPPPSSRSGANPRQVSPGQVFQGLDQDWFLNDGAKWHQNFEAWNMAGAGMPTGEQMFMFQGGNNASSGGNGGGGGGGMGPPRQSSEDASSATFDGLSSLNTNGWLPGLD